MVDQDKGIRLREAVGVFAEGEALNAAIEELLAAGVGSDSLGLLASEQVVRQSLGDFRIETNQGSDATQREAIAFLDNNALAESGQSLGGGLFFIGTAGLGGALVSSAAILGGAALAALGGAVGVGLVGLAVAKVIQQDDADYLQQQVDEGRLLLFVRLDDASEREVKAVLERHQAIDVRMLEVPLESGKP